jgi:2'-5' RNA ligase
VRLFFASWPPLETAQALHRWAAEVRNESGGKLTVVENLHLTLAFLGDADPARAIDAARYVKRNEMVWVGAAAMPVPLLSLATDLHAELRRAGFTLEERPFAAHITLVRKARMPKSIPPLPNVSWPVDEFVLVASKTSASGSVYTPLDRFVLS